MNSAPLTVVYSTDENFWEHTYVSMHSLLVNNRDISFDIRILSDAPNEEFFRNSERLKTLHGNASIEWLPVDPGTLRKAPTTQSVTGATYYRLLLGELLPESIDRLLYIDGDAIVRGSIHPLLALDISDVVLAAVAEYVPGRQQPPFKPHPTRLGLPGGSPYFNAGLLFINLDAWRTLDVGGQGIQYVINNLGVPGMLDFYDQDPLNVICAGKWLPLGPHFNFQDWSTADERFDDHATRIVAGYDVPAEGPLIAHFTGGFKPWHGSRAHPYAHDYWHYRFQTPYGSRIGYWKVQVRGLPSHLRNTIIRTIRRLPGGNTALQTVRIKLLKPLRGQ